MNLNNLQFTQMKPRNETHSSHSGTKSKEIERFRALLDPAQQETPSPAFTPLTILSDNGEPDDGSGTPIPSEPRLTAISTGTAVPNQIIDEIQNIIMKVCNGPLAGLMVQAYRQGRRLEVKLSVPPGPVGRRLVTEQDKLSTMLSDTLAVDVVLNVEELSSQRTSSSPLSPQSVSPGKSSKK